MASRLTSATGRPSRARWWALLAALATAIAAVTVACGGDEVVEKVVVQTVIVEKQVPGEKVVETVIVEKVVTEKVVETVIVEKVVEKEVVLVATPTQVPTGAMRPAVIPSGSLTVAVSDVGTANTAPQDCTACWFLGQASVWDPLLLQTRAEDGTVILSPGLAESWIIAPDGTYTDFKIRKGVQFHNGWGELTAQDVAFTFDIENSNIHPDSVNGISTEFLNFIVEPLEVIGQDTVRIKWESHPSFLELKLLTKLFKTQGVFSERVYNEKGSEWMIDNFISTGPFVLEEWKTGERMVTRAFVGHWLITPGVASITRIEVPEASTRRAMLESGEAEIAEIEVKDWPALLEGDRFKKAAEGIVQDSGWIMGGNYWEKVHPISGAPLERVLKTDLPWVADPDDPEGMERARKVRLALSFDIDREGINQAVLKGLGRPSHQGGINDQDPLFKDEWKTEYDPTKAKQLLAEAGYADGFTVDIYVRPGSTAGLIARAMAAGWLQDLNVDTNILEQPYGTYRPNYINRTSTELSVRNGGASFPSTWQEEWLISAVVALKDGSAGGGFNSGIELPAASESIAKKNAAKSDAEIEDAVRDLYDYISFWAVWPGVVEWDVSPLYNAEVIAEWRKLPASSGGIRDTEWITLR